MLGPTLAFLAVATLIIISPGPDSLLTVRNAAGRGYSGGLVTAAGILTGLCFWAVAAALGLAALVRASELGYDILRLAGAAYLIWLGIAALRASRRPAEDAPDQAPPARGLARMFGAGTLSNLFNPKIGVFFVAFLPGFVPAGGPVGPTSLLFGAIFVVATALWLALLTVLVARGVSWLSRPGARRVLDRITGVVMIGFGIRLATEARSLA